MRVWILIVCNLGLAVVMAAQHSPVTSSLIFGVTVGLTYLWRKGKVGRDTMFRLLIATFFVGNSVWFLSQH